MYWVVKRNRYAYLNIEVQHEHRWCRFLGGATRFVTRGAAVMVRDAEREAEARETSLPVRICLAKVTTRAALRREREAAKALAMAAWGVVNKLGLVHEPFTQLADKLSAYWDASLCAPPPSKPVTLASTADVTCGDDPYQIDCLRCGLAYWDKATPCPCACHRQSEPSKPATGPVCRVCKGETCIGKLRHQTFCSCACHRGAAEGDRASQSQEKKR